MKGTPYERIGGLSPARSAFDRSHSRMFDADLGRLIPVLIEDVQPGDIYEIGASQITKMQPMVVPLYHRMSICYHTFFVPYRLIWANWPKFITGGATGDANIALPNLLADNTAWPVQLDRYGLWDYAGFRMDAATNTLDITRATQVQDFVWRAYWAIWRDYYRDENLQPNYPRTSIDVGMSDVEQLEALDTLMTTVLEDGAGVNWMPADTLAYRSYAKDYFTSALPWQQRGTSPAIPVSGSSSAVWPSTAFGIDATGTNLKMAYFDHVHALAPLMYGVSGVPEPTMLSNMQDWANSNTVDLDTQGINISDLRYGIQIQKWMERNARGGYRYNEYIFAHFGEAPRDERLQRPEYIGGMVQPIITSEVLQTSSTDANSPQGSFAGHGMAVGSQMTGRYHVREHGIIMGIMSIMPEAVYQQGIPRQWTRQTRFDFFSPEFAHLSEQEIKRSEIYWINDPAYDDIRFGFQGAYDEYRTAQSVVCGRLATDLDVWTLSRQFSAPPALNETFITTEALSKTRRQAWAVTGVENNEQGEFLIRWNNHVRALRPMPYIPDPGLMDHF